MTWIKAANIMGARGERGPAGPTGESMAGPPGPSGRDGVGIASHSREGGRIFVELDDGRALDFGDFTGPRGEKGEPGVGVAGAIIDRSGGLILTLSDGNTRDLGIVVGVDGKDGAPGRDGFGFEEIDVTHDGERAFMIRFARGSESKEFGKFVVPAQIYRGVHVDGQTYDRGDTVTYSGSLYHCNEATTEKPGAGSKAWTLAAKRGDEGRSAYRIAQKAGFQGSEAEWLKSLRGPPGPEGKPGRDLTQRGPDGSRW